jgi:hypothetical protein
MDGWRIMMLKYYSYLFNEKNIYLFKGNLKPRKRTLENSTRFSNTV